MSLNPLRDVRYRAHELIDYHDGKFQTFAFIVLSWERSGSNRIAYLLAPAGRRRYKTLDAA
jgi:hypothetical protein